MQESEREAGSRSQGGPSQAAAALDVQQGGELTGMPDGKAVAQSSLLSSYSEMPTAPTVRHGHTMRGSSPEVSPWLP